MNYYIQSQINQKIQEKLKIRADDTNEWYRESLKLSYQEFHQRLHRLEKLQTHLQHKH